MGLLDDAIREHLDLKRRHGAPEGEVDRLATEVFGPVRAPAPAEPTAPVEDVQEPIAETPDAPAAQPAPPPAAVEPLPVEDPAPPHGDALEETVSEHPAPFADDEPWLEEPDEVMSGDRLDHPRTQPTTEFTPDEHASARGETGYVEPDEEPAEDLLEETPEFLQETPEHDRLWFEQKPPKDFDFGG